MYRSRITTESEISRPVPQNSAMQMKDSISATDFADARGRSLAMAAFISASTGGPVWPMVAI